MALVVCLRGSLACGDDNRPSDGDSDAAPSEDGGRHAQAPDWSTTGALCDPALRYEQQIAPLLERYCTRCHASTVKLAERMGAPASLNFDSEAGLVAAAHEIDEQAGAGPTRTNFTMPPSSPMPTQEEREKLSAYLACQ